MRPPGAYSYLGATAPLVYIEDENDIFYAIGRHAVSAYDQRSKLDYGLYNYTSKERAFIHKNKRINGHIIQEYRAYTYAYYFHGWFNYKTYGWNKKLGSVIDIFDQQKNWSTYDVQTYVDWLHYWKLLDNFTPTGKLFAGIWELDNPRDILKGLEYDF